MAVHLLVWFLRVFYLLVLFWICKGSELLNLWFFHASPLRPPDTVWCPGFLTSICSWPHSTTDSLVFISWLPNHWLDSDSDICLALSGPPACWFPHNCITNTLQGRGWHFFLLKPSRSSRTFANQAIALPLAFRAFHDEATLYIY